MLSFGSIRIDLLMLFGCRVIYLSDYQYKCFFCELVCFITVHYILNSWGVVMKGRFLLSSNDIPAMGNIYADKSSLTLDWLSRDSLTKHNFSLREVAKEINVSIGLVQRVFKLLALKGFL